MITRVSPGNITAGKPAPLRARDPLEARGELGPQKEKLQERKTGEEFAAQLSGAVLVQPQLQSNPLPASGASPEGAVSTLEKPKKDASGVGAEKGLPSQVELEMPAGSAMQAEARMRAGFQAGAEASAQAGFQAAAQPSGEIQNRVAEASQRKSFVTSPRQMESQRIGGESAPANERVASLMTGMTPWNSDWIFEGAAHPLASAMKAPESSGPITEGARDAGAAGGSAAGVSMDPLTAQDPSFQSRMGVEVQEVREAQGERPMRPEARGSLSGAEFLDTLASVRAAGAERGSRFGSNQNSDRNFNGSPADNVALLSELRPGKGGASKRASASGTGETGIGQSAEQLSIFAGHATQASGANPLGSTEFRAISQNAQQLSGNVVQGAMARERLTSESLMGLSGGIQGFQNKLGGGEIRLRLRPDNLGELHLRVSSHGREVGLQIQASSDRAKKILEESLSHLKESLAAQQLSLGPVEVSVAQSRSGADSSSDQRNMGNPNLSQGQDLPQWNSSGDTRGNRDGAWERAQDGSEPVSRVRGSRGGAQDAFAAGIPRATNRAAQNGMLDVMA